MVKSTQANSSIIQNQLVKLYFRLHLHDGKYFRKEDRIRWELNDDPRHHMIELDCSSEAGSRLSDHVLDVRRLATNWLEIVFVARLDKSEIFTIKINTSSVDFAKDDDLTFGTPFQFQLLSWLKRSDIELDQIKLGIFTTRQGEALRVAQKWLEANGSQQNKIEGANELGENRFV